MGGAPATGGFRAPPHPYDTAPPAFRLRPLDAEEPPRRSRRTLAVAVCLVLGTGLLGGSAVGTWISAADEPPRTAEVVFDESRSLWHTVPVDTLFPRTVKGDGTGPGGADRRWTRVAVAPDSTCQDAFDPALADALSEVGCRRLLRATYADETSSSVTTVGLLFTKADAGAMRALRERLTTEGLDERTDFMPRPYAARGTLAADFGDAQRASWALRVLTDAPAVVYTVTGFADGRTVSAPQSAGEAIGEGQTTAPAQAGLGHEAKGLADLLTRRLRAQLPEADPEDAS